MQICVCTFSSSSESVVIALRSCSTLFYYIISLYCCIFDKLLRLKIFYIPFYLLHTVLFLDQPFLILIFYFLSLVIYLLFMPKMLLVC